MNKSKRSGFTHLNEGDYKAIKTLQKAGVSQYKVSKATKRSNNTIGRIYETNSFKEYRQLTTERNNVYRKPVQQNMGLASVETISEVIRQAKETGGLVITTHAAFVGFDDLYDFVKEASDNEVTVTFAPMGR